MDAQGNPLNVRVLRPLGMGLDEKAVKALRQYKFKPSVYQGHPVAVEVNVEVNFRIYARRSRTVRLRALVEMNVEVNFRIY